MNLHILMSGLEGEDLVKFKKWFFQDRVSRQINSFVEKKCSIQQTQQSDSSYDTSLLTELKRIPNDVPMKPGQIRLLNGEMVSRPLEITYVLVLSQWTGNRWLIAPFSPYLAPATEGELDTEIKSHLYRVVEAWNATVVPDLLLRSQSEYLRDVDEAVRKDACTVFFQKLEGDDVPDELKSRVGPPIKNDLDPRIQYLMKEKDQLEPLRKKAQEVEEFLRAMEPFESAPWTQKGDTALAASDKTEPVLYLSVKDHQERIKVFRAEKEIVFEFYSADFIDYSNSFDSWYIVSEKGCVLGKIEGCRCRITNEIPLESICLAAPDGDPIPLSRAEV
jgi:hypothetical protein